MSLTRRRFLGSTAIALGVLATGPSANGPGASPSSTPGALGAVGDGRTDDSAASQAACDDAAGRLPSLTPGVAI